MRLSMLSSAAAAWLEREIWVVMAIKLWMKEDIGQWSMPYQGKLNQPTNQELGLHYQYQDDQREDRNIDQQQRQRRAREAQD